MAEPRVRAATEADVDALVALRAQMFTDMGLDASDTYWRQQAGTWFLAHLNDATVCLRVVEVGGEVVACAMGTVRPAAPSPAVPDGNDVLISNVCTSPHHRGNGYGQAAYDAVMQWVRASGIGRAELFATDAGRRMYERDGFTPAGVAMRMTLGR